MSDNSKYKVIFIILEKFLIGNICVLGWWMF